MSNSCYCCSSILVIYESRYKYDIFLFLSFQDIKQGDKTQSGQLTSHHFIENSHQGSIKQKDTYYELPFDISHYEQNELLQVSQLNVWDYPIFDLASSCENFILSQASIFLIKSNLFVLIFKYTV